MAAESGVRVKFNLRRIDSLWRMPEAWSELAWLLAQLETFGCLPVMEDGLLAGNVALSVEDELIVSRSGRRPGELKAEDFVRVVHFDPDRWEASYISADAEMKPTSDTPLHWAALKDSTFDGGSEPLVSVHGHALATAREALALGIPISPVETEFSTSADRSALAALIAAHPYPSHAVFVRRGHGFFVLAESVAEAAVRVKDMMDRAALLTGSTRAFSFSRSPHGT